MLFFFFFSVTNSSRKEEGSYLDVHNFLSILPDDSRAKPRAGAALSCVTDTESEAWGPRACPGPAGLSLSGPHTAWLSPPLSPSAGCPCLRVFLGGSGRGRVLTAVLETAGEENGVSGGPQGQGEVCTVWASPRVHHVLGRGLCLFFLSTAISGSPLAPLVMQLVQLGFKQVGGSGSPLVSLTHLHSGLFLDSGPACPPARSPQGLSAPHPRLEASTGDPPAPPHLSPSLCRPQALSGCFPCGQQFLLISRGRHGQLGALLPHTRGVREAEPRAPAGVEAKARGGPGLSACRAPGWPSWEPTLFLGCQHNVSLACSLGRW